jgi:type III pantothenate kinase
VTGIAVSSVVPPLNQLLDAACRTYLQVAPLFIGPGVATGMPVLYDNPHQLGSDRLANAVAAFARTRGAAIVVDLGTATKFEYVSAAGAYLGGAIAPGLGIAADALFERAARLHRVELVTPGRVLGRNTVHAIQSGLVYGYAAMVDGMVRRIRAECGGAVRVVATGGFAPLVASEAACIDDIDEFLTLDGVRLIYERNSAH